MKSAGCPPPIFKQEKTIYHEIQPFHKTGFQAGSMRDLDYTRLTRAIEEQLHRKGRLIVAIDGRCGSGKTTLATRLREELSCSVFHMDDFFPQPYQRTETRLSQPGENVDHERFLAEVLLPLHSALPVTFRPYLCARQELGAPVTVPFTPLTIVEGSYACHPTLWEYYDLRIFLSVDPEEQMRRIRKRNGSGKALLFRDRWIPFEERYFSAFRVAEHCDMLLQG